MKTHHPFGRTAPVLALLLLSSPALAQKVKIREQSVSSQLTDDTISEAINLWLEDSDAAERTYGKIGEWDTSEITNLDKLFQNKDFNEDISQWDTSKVTSMEYTYAASKFNSPLNAWNVARVTSMYGLFNGAADFNQNLDEWQTDQVHDMRSCFKGASSFNSRLFSKTDKVTSMEMMFFGATFFEDVNNSLLEWNVDLVTSMDSMFSGATRFQGDLSLWNPKSVESFSGMFAYAVSFDPDSVNLWSVASAKSMDRMFYRALKFEAELCWDTLQAGVSGVDMLCGSSGTFDPGCSNTHEPFGSEDCSEARMEMEEEYEIKEANLHSIVVPERDAPARGGSGGIGAMNPGAEGRDHPEATARYDDNSAGSILDEEPYQARSQEAPKIGPVVDAETESAAAQSVEEESSARRRRYSCLPILLVVATTSLATFLL